MNSITDKLTGTGNKSATHNPNTDAQNEDYADKGESSSPPRPARARVAQGHG